MRLALCQINVTVGDIAGNLERVRAAQRACEEAEAELVLYPELALTGYPPEDLLLREHFLADARSALEELAKDVGDSVAVVGFPERAEDVYNAAAVLWRGSVQAVYRKMHLANYGGFDEQRYFKACAEGGASGPGGAGEGAASRGCPTAEHHGPASGGSRAPARRGPPHRERADPAARPGGHERARLHPWRACIAAGAARARRATAAALACGGRGVRG